MRSSSGRPLVLGVVAMVVLTRGIALGGCCWNMPASGGSSSSGCEPILDFPEGGPVRLDASLPPERDGSLRDGAPEDAPRADAQPEPECPLRGVVAGETCRSAGLVCDDGSECVDGLVRVRSLEDDGMGGVHERVRHVADGPTWCRAACDPSDEAACGPCASCTARAVAGWPELLEEASCRLPCDPSPDGPGSCPGELVCDPRERVCLAPCWSDEMCSLARRGEALVELEGGTCSVTAQRCVYGEGPRPLAGTRCESDRECGRDALCLRGAGWGSPGICAGAACDVLGCGEGEVCVDVRGHDPTRFACMRACTSDGECASGTLCEGELCVPTCSSDAQCDEGWVCASSDGASCEGEDARCRCALRIGGIGERDAGTPDQ